jgi:hypothetical protein
MKLYSIGYFKIMTLTTYINNTSTYIVDFLYVVAHMFCYIVHWDGLLSEKP